MKILVTSANFGSSYFPPYTEQKSENEIVIQRYTDENYPSRKNSLHPRMKGKIPKMMEWHFSPGYDYYIWMDSRFEISREDSVDWLVEQCKSKHMCLFRHPSRNSVKEEATHVLELMGNSYIRDRYEGENIERQVEDYLSDYRFNDNKLFACGLFVYHKTTVPTSDNLMKDWFLHNALYSVQDQLSLPYLLQKHGVMYETIEQNIFDCEYFRYR